MNQPAQSGSQVVPARRGLEPLRHTVSVPSAQQRPLRVLLRVPDVTQVRPTAYQTADRAATQRRARLTTLIRRNGVVWNWPAQRLASCIPRLQLQPKLLLVLIGSVVVFLILAIVRGQRPAEENTSLGSAPQWRAPEVELPSVPVVQFPPASAATSNQPGIATQQLQTPPTNPPAPAGAGKVAAPPGTPSQPIEAKANEGLKITPEERPELRTAQRPEPPRDMPRNHPFDGPPTARIEGHIVSPPPADRQP